MVNSKTFESSEIHRRLLMYLADKALAGEAGRLKEYTVGLEAFGKPSSYDPRHDSIVRLQVGRLRQKLTTYYQTEANGDSIQITLPKGGFKLNFEPVVPVENGDTAEPRSRRPWLWMIATVVLGLWAVAATWGWVRAQRTVRTVDRWTPELEALWAPFLNSRRSLLVCVGTPLFVRFPGYGFFRDPRTNDWAQTDKSERIATLKKALGDKDLLPSNAFTGVGEAGAAVLVSKLLSTRKDDVLLTRSNILSWQQVADHDVIFIGPPKFNLQLQAAALTRDIVVEADGIRNLKPRPGEPVFLQDHIESGKTQEGETHALISRTPGLSGAGELLVIGGNASPDTMAAAEWLTQPERAKELVKRLRTQSGTVPRYFQAVIKVAFRQGTPVQSTYVYHHEVTEAAR